MSDVAPEPTRPEVELEEGVDPGGPSDEDQEGKTPPEERIT